MVLTDLDYPTIVIAAVMRLPLFWFIVIGTGIFAIDSFRHERSDNLITISEGDRQGIRDQWRSQTGKPIDSTSLDAMVDELVQERRLAREAIALGLDRNDVVVRRRLAQKLRFLTEGLSDDLEPSPAELEAFFDSRRSDYVEPASWSFRHVYFSKSTRGDNAKSDASATHSQLQEQKSQYDERPSGDAFIHGEEFKNVSEQEVEKVFGTFFVRRLGSYARNTWGPAIESSLGYHLLWVSGHQFERTRPLIEVSDEVLYDYRVVQRKIAFENYLAMLARKYPVHLLRDEGSE